MRKIYIQVLFLSLLFGVNGSVIFYDGTAFEGEIVSVDPLYVYIIPTGLPLPEEILTEYIATLILENGFVIVENSRAVQGYKDEKFIILDDYSFKDPWKSDQYFFESGLDDYYSKSYGDYRKETKPSEYQQDSEFNQPKYVYSLPQPYSGLETSRTSAQKKETLNTKVPLVKSSTFGSIAIFSGFPLYQSTSLSWITKDFKDGITLPNVGVSGAIPFKFGPLSGFGGQLMTMGFMSEYKESYSIKAIQAAAYMNIGISRLLTFLPPNMKLEAIFGPSYHIGWNVPYTGVGFIIGGILDYWFEGTPIGVRLFGNGHIIPGPGTTSDTPADDLGAFGNIGIAFLTSFALTSR
tara:strand:+ start:5314 stop:6363 length:1050 start_codon:yes stop_codon:yes gene_type:complete